ncbi:MAG: tryptophan 2,3-dioxygenase [Polyangiaceae bacterium]|nr:tryptophan 2,3-dioxygenase [Polyangiaceae bacterium]
MIQPPPTYWDYLQLDALLSLQGGLERDESKLLPDELHFVLVHQTFELWFKLLLSELRLARDHLAEPRVPEEHVPFVVHHLRRGGTILEHTIDAFRVMETLTPQDFLAFRDKLVPASGFQSFQMRELEILLGLEEAQRAAYAGSNPLDHIEKLAGDTPAGRLARERLQAVRGERTLRAALHDWLHRTPIHGSSPGDPGDEGVVERFLADYLARLRAGHAEKLARLTAVLATDPAALARQLEASTDAARDFLEARDVDDAARPRARRVRAGALFIESYRELPLLAWPRLLLDTVVELEEQLVLWRTRHARMVERVIGRRVGTGGSSGVDYLDQTARHRIFGELWTVRAVLLARDALPGPAASDRYGFAPG